MITMANLKELMTWLSGLAEANPEIGTINDLLEYAADLMVTAPDTEDLATQLAYIDALKLVFATAGDLQAAIPVFGSSMLNVQQYSIATGEPQIITASVNDYGVPYWNLVGDTNAGYKFTLTSKAGDTMFELAYGTVSDGGSYSVFVDGVSKIQSLSMSEITPSWHNIWRVSLGNLAVGTHEIKLVPWNDNVTGVWGRLLNFARFYRL